MSKPDWCSILFRMPHPLVLIGILSILAVDVLGQDEHSLRSIDEVESLQICELCKCSEVESLGEDKSQALRITCNEVSVNVDQFPNLERLEWPTYDFNSIIVKFEALGLAAVQRLPANHYIERLSFEGNSITTIWPAAFTELDNLLVLSLAHNNLAEITPDIFTNLAQLEELDLSYNKLTDFNELQFKELKSLKKLLLKHNALTNVPVQTLSKIPNLEYLDLSMNQIFYLEMSEPSVDIYILSKIKYLDLSHNKITMLRSTTFEKADVLEYLDVSGNNIGNVDDNVFVGCTNLIEINLSNNDITTTLDLPPNVQVLRISQNKLYKWPNLPSNTKLLDISFNNMVSSEDLILMTMDDLEVLNISGNQLSNFEIPQKCPNLRVLDISYNSIIALPASINSDTLPSLEELRIDGNPLKSLHFPQIVALKRLFANQLNEIANLDENSLVNLRARGDGQQNAGLRENEVKADDVQELKSADCMEISISHCSKLSTIHENAFQGVPICHLDLSYNNLTSLSKGITNWSLMVNGVNLQGNPWDCQCHLQWILDELLQDLYVSHPTLLHELRCESPRNLMGLRLVHWYNWGEGALCHEGSSKKSENYVILASGEGQTGFNLVMGSSTVFITVLVCVSVGLVAVIILIVYVVRSKNQHNYRVRQAMKRRRQTLEDRKNANSLPILN